MSKAPPPVPKVRSADGTLRPTATPPATPPPSVKRFAVDRELLLLLYGECWTCRRCEQAFVSIEEAGRHVCATHGDTEAVGEG